MNETKQSVPGFILITMSVLALLVLSPGDVAADPTWPGGTPIVQFDKRDDAPMTLAADWQGMPERRWAGPTIWTNRLQDWMVREGALECVSPGNARTAHLLTYDLGDKPEPFRLEVVIRLAPGSPQAGFAGFLIGAGEGKLDYRGASLVHNLPGRGGGILAVVETSGKGGLAFRDMSRPETALDYPLLEGQTTLVKEPIHLDDQRMILNLEGIPSSKGRYQLRLSVWSQRTGDLLGAQVLGDVPAARLRGNVALVAHPAGKAVRHVFERFKGGGGRLEPHPERAFGPIAGTLYSLSDRSTLKLSVQFMSLGEALGPKRRRLAARLEARMLGNEEESNWTLVGGPKAISTPDYYILFRVTDWDTSHDWETRVVFEDERGSTHTYLTIVRRDPVDKPVVSLAAFTGMGVMGRRAYAKGPEPGEGEMVIGRWTPANIWMPFAEAVQAVAKQDVDILFFTGDQIYEFKPSRTDRARNPKEDYLYRWLLWHWSFQDLTNSLPAIVQTDDHDVYHGNLWGWGGRLSLTDNVNDGGYRNSPYFVNLVHRTQTGHNPDPYDPAPVENGITNYYGSFTYGSVGFAVLEDRKFKTPPAVTDPAEQVMLGKRQLQFLKEWGEDWTGQKFKVVVSQTIYAAMHTNFNGSLSRDPDTNGFTKVGRDRALRLFRRCGALVVSGDQHLSTFARLGIDRPSDAVYQFSVPAMGNIWWRWFYPETPGIDRQPGEPDYLGEFTDLWDNYFRMIAVANPERRELLGQKLHQRSVIPEIEAKEGLGDTVRTCRGEGYGVVRFNKAAQMITVESWPHNADPRAGGQQFPGWPRMLKLEDLDGRKPVAWLPDIVIKGQPDPVVQIINQATDEIIKVTRAREGFYRPGVFDPNQVYILRVGEPGPGHRWWEVRDLKPSAQAGKSVLKVDMRR